MDGARLLSIPNLSFKTIRDEAINDRFLAPGSSGALVILDHYVCGFIIASRQDVPLASRHIPLGYGSQLLRAAGVPEIKSSILPAPPPS